MVRKNMEFGKLIPEKYWYVEGNLGIWGEILHFCKFVHKNTIQIGENWACFPENKHFFILCHQNNHLWLTLQVYIDFGKYGAKLF